MSIKFKTSIEAPSVGDIIDLDFQSAYSNYYHELTYTSGDLTAINIWEDNTKAVSLFTKTFTYTSGDLTQIVVTNEVTSATLTKDLVYDINGNLEKITRTYARPTPTPWTPSNTTTSLWLDAYDSSTIIHTSDAVSQWSDKSGNENHAIQNTLANQPTYTTTIISGQPGLDFDSDKLNVTAIDMKGKTLLVILEHDSGNSIQQIFTDENGGNNQLRVDDTNKLGFAAAPPTLYSSPTTSTATVPINTPYIAGFVVADTLGFSINGTFENTLGSRNESGNSLFDQIAARGAGNTAATSTALKGKIGEFIVIDSTSTQDRQKAEGYLAHKWGLTGGLPSGHPYKSQAPLN